MVKIMESPIKMDDLGVFSLFLETPKWTFGMFQSDFFATYHPAFKFHAVHHSPKA